MNRMTFITRCAPVVLAVGALWAATAGAAVQETGDMADMRREMAELRRMIEQRDSQIEAMEQRLGQLPQPDDAVERTQMTQQAIDRVLADIDAQESQRRRELVGAQIGGGRVRLTDISLVLSSAVGTSSVRGSELRALQGGAHDPNQRGFNFQGGELSIGGAVDPLFYAEAHILFDDDHVELEEGFVLTQSMPMNLQLKAGYFLTEFGRINRQHAHEWHWIDQPIINTRFFGGEGMRGPGARLGWLAPLPWYSQIYFGLQNPNDASMISFLGGGHAHEHNEEHDDHDDEHDDHGDGIGGLHIVDRHDVRSMRDLVYLMRWANSWDVSDDVTMLLGASGLYGPNPAGRRGETWIYGADLTLKWQPTGAAWPYLTWQSEFMRRHYRTSAFSFEADDGDIEFAPRTTLRDWGIYSQVLYGFAHGWAAGIRGEFATGRGGDERDEDPLRADRYRVSPMVMWQPTEFSRMRLQYNLDRADFLHDSRTAHSVWLGLEVLLGTHPAHGF